MRIASRLLVVVVAAFLVSAIDVRAGDSPSAAASDADAIDDALATVGLTRGDLGWEARGWWDRYPQDIPYKMRHVDDLFAEPLATVPWLRTMGAEVKTLLSPEGLAKRGDQGQGSLFRLVHDLGVHRRYGATRPYSANLAAQPVAPDSAMKLVYWNAGKGTRYLSLGKPADWPNLDAEIEARVAPLQNDVGWLIGQLIHNLIHAQTAVDQAWRNTTLETRMKVYTKLNEGIEETDALDYEPAMDDLAKTWDEASLWQGGLHVVEALDVARQALPAAVAKVKDSLKTFRFDMETPRGRIVILGTGDDTLDVGTEGAWLVVDLGGNDHYIGSVAASSATRPIGALLDLSGDDTYEAKDRAQGSGSVGVGVLLDAAGNDTYRLTGTLGQGAAQFGLGVLADVSGDDVYDAAYSAQGCGFFGVGMLLDSAGKDSYRLFSDGQGFGGVAGVGVLADRSGDDRYEAVVDPKVTGRPSYHTENKVTVSNAQGCGMGRRGDASDGHSWAGGVGCLLDAEGSDHYVAANWCQGCGYWFGTGLLWDGAGDDDFQANGWASGSGAHFSIGCLVDESGNDVHHVTQNWGPGYGHDFTVGICCDLGGNDRYEAGGAGIGWSINRSVALLIDVGGDDHYSYTTPELRPGTAVADARFLDRSGATPLYWTESTSVGLFLDVGGHDEYPAGAANDAVRTDPASGDNRRAKNFSIAVDRPDGRVDLDRPQGGKRR